MLLYPDISNFTFYNVKNLKCNIFLIDFLDKLGNFKQKKIYTLKCKIFLHFKATDPKKPFQNLEQDAWKSPAGQIGPYREESSSPQNKTKSKTILGVKYS